MSEAFTEAVSARICKHMNKDHADSVMFYVQHYSQLSDATAAQMLKIEATGMDIMAQVDGQEVPVRIPFEPPLSDAKAAHHKLVDMLKREA